MGRSKRRRKKKQRSQNDLHHLLWIRKLWSKGAIGRLRAHPYCTVSIPRDTLHRHIHTFLAHIPVPKETTAKVVLAQLDLLEKYRGISLEDPIEKRLEVLIALFAYIEPTTAEALRKQLDLVREFNKSLE